jgi:hypothetical protein
VPKSPLSLAIFLPTSIPVRQSVPGLIRALWAET